MCYRRFSLSVKVDLSHSYGSAMCVTDVSHWEMKSSTQSVIEGLRDPFSLTKSS